MRTPRAAIAIIALLCATGCDFSTSPTGEVADVRGTWQFSGDQDAPALTLEGTLLIQSQAGDAVSGQLSWQEHDGLGGSVAKGGAVSGLVIEHSDVDFDVILPGGNRRHVGSITGDTIRGAWLEVGSGKSGSWAAVRSTP